MLWIVVTSLSVASNAAADMKVNNIGTLNVRGIGDDDDKFALVEDADKYKLDILTLSETHIPEEECLYDIESAEKKEYVLYGCNDDGNHHHGVGFLIRKELEPDFKRISGRIAQATIQMSKRKIHIIAIYAPTLQNCEKDPTMREDFYNSIEATIDKIPKRDLLFIAGDLNAKVGSQQHADGKECVGVYGKGKRNSSGEMLVDVCIRKDLCIANTFFQHKLGHRTTWTAPMRKFTCHDGTVRRNPVRNQIDYVITRKDQKHLITDARSFGGTYTNTDHKMVIMNIKLAEHKLRKNTEKGEPRLRINEFNDEEKRKKYEEATKVIEVNPNSSPQEMWNTIVKKCKEVGKEILGKKEKRERIENPTLKKLCEEKQKVKKDNNSVKDQQIRKEKIGRAHV